MPVFKFTEKHQRLKFSLTGSGWPLASGACGRVPGDKCTRSQIGVVSPVPADPGNGLRVPWILPGSCCVSLSWVPANQDPGWHQKLGSDCVFFQLSEESKAPVIRRNEKCYKMHKTWSISALIFSLKINFYFWHGIPRKGCHCWVPRCVYLWFLLFLRSVLASFRTCGGVSSFPSLTITWLGASLMGGCPACPTVVFLLALNTFSCWLVVHFPLFWSACWNF